MFLNLCFFFFNLCFLRQTSCNPSCALPPISVGNASPKGVEDPDVIFQKLMQQAASNQLDSLMGLSSSPSVEDSIIIPCEFCGVQLEEEVLFHHQVRTLGGPVHFFHPVDPLSEPEAFRAKNASLAFKLCAYLIWLLAMSCFVSCLRYKVPQAFGLSPPSGSGNHPVTSCGPRSQDSI